MNLLSFKPDVIITEKGIADLAIYYLQKGGASLIRRIRKTDNNRISKACGATIIHRLDANSQILRSRLTLKCIK